MAAAGGRYRRSLPLPPLTPCRLLDTRQTDGPYGGPSVPPQSQRVVVATGQCGIPATAKALATNVTVVQSPQAGSLIFFPADDAVPNTNTISFSAGQVRANNAVIALASSGSGALAFFNSAPSQPAHLLIDVSGYFE